MKTRLKAYRLSEIELETFDDLRSLFNEANYELPLRLPEIYYADLHMIKAFFDLPKNDEEGTPDYLGVYLQESTEDDYISQEGIIILFKDRIEQHSRGQKDQENALRFYVLMHELGHWISHMAKYNGDNECFQDTKWKNWEIGFNRLGNPSKIKETIAELVAYWSCTYWEHTDESAERSRKKLKSDALDWLTKLTPTDSNGNININDPYGAYWPLKDVSASELINRLKLVQLMCMLSDENLYNMFCSKHNETIKNGINLIDSFINENHIKPKIDLIGNHCSCWWTLEEIYKRFKWIEDDDRDGTEVMLSLGLIDCEESCRK